jgi:hypothetical protein
MAHWNDCNHAISCQGYPGNGVQMAHTAMDACGFYVKGKGGLGHEVPSHIL